MKARWQLALVVSGMLLGFGCDGRSVVAPEIPTKPDTASIGEVVPTGRLTTARAAHTATLLPDGSVLFIGGMNGAGSSSEAYDPDEGAFSSRARTLSARDGGHAAVLLPSGLVLVTGGWSDDAVSATAELYDPATDRFSAAGSMQVARSAHAAMLLPSGEVLIIGGFDGSNRLDSAELYDPRTGKFTRTGSMAEPRSEFAAAALPDGRVLVTGGNRSRGQLLASAEIYDRATGAFQQAGEMTVARHKHGAATLSDGRVLILGGSDARDGRGRYSSTELFDPRKGGFTKIADMNAARFKFPRAVVRLDTGQVLVAGGGKQLEVYDPASGRFRLAAGSVDADLSFATATLLADGRVLIAGGYDERIEPTAGAWLYQGGKP